MAFAVTAEFSFKRILAHRSEAAGWNRLNRKENPISISREIQSLKVKLVNGMFVIVKFRSNSCLCGWPIISFSVMWKLYVCQFLRQTSLRPRILMAGSYIFRLFDVPPNNLSNSLYMHSLNAPFKDLRKKKFTQYERNESKAGFKFLQLFCAVSKLFDDEFCGNSDPLWYSTSLNSSLYWMKMPKTFN